MNCKKCNATISSDDKFCRSCGAQIIIDGQNDIINSNDFDERFIKAYIGPKADKMYHSVKNGGINIWGVIFGVYYFIYRKMYLVSLIIILISGIVMYLLPVTTNYIGIFIGLMFCPIYKWDITRKLRKIKNQNLNANENQLLDIAQKKGGTSIIGVIPLLAIYLLMIFYIFR